MPATSKTQRRFFGWALAHKRGEPGSYPAHVRKLSESMTEEQLKDYASTEEAKLPEKKASFREFLVTAIHLNSK